MAGRSSFAGLGLALVLGLSSSLAEEGKATLNTLAELRAHLQTCLTPGVMSDGQEVTLRFAFKGNGQLLGPPRVTYVKGAPNPVMRKVLSDDAVASVQKCTPLALTKSFSGAIAGRVYTIRIVGGRVLPLT